MDATIRELADEIRQAATLLRAGQGDPLAWFEDIASRLESLAGPETESEE